MTCKKQAEAQPIDGLAIVKETSTLGKLIIKGVPKEEAKRMIVENHYSHKWNEGGFGKYNFGVFRAEEPDKCLGVAVYGYMKNPAAKIFSHPNPKAWVCELNRMWIDDTLGEERRKRVDRRVAQTAAQSRPEHRRRSELRRRSPRLRNDLQGVEFPVLRIPLHAVPAEQAHGRNDTRADFDDHNVADRIFALEYRVFDWRFGSVAGENISLHLPALQTLSVHKAGKTLSAV